MTTGELIGLAFITGCVGATAGALVGGYGVGLSLYSAAMKVATTGAARAAASVLFDKCLYGGMAAGFGLFSAGTVIGAGAADRCRGNKNSDSAVANEETGLLPSPSQ